MMRKSKVYGKDVLDALMPFKFNGGKTEMIVRITESNIDNVVFDNLTPFNGEKPSAGDSVYFIRNNKKYRAVFLKG
jgi:hypothetical protein